MKRLALITLVAATAASSFAQGFLDWGNNFSGSFRAPIYGPEVGNATLSLSGQSALGVSAGSTVYTGPLLTGSGYTFAIYAGPASAADSSALTLLVSTTFRTGNGTALPSGLVLGGTITVPGVAAGSQAKFQVRAWDNTGGLDFAASATKGASAVVTTAALGGIEGLSHLLHLKTI